MKKTLLLLLIFCCFPALSQTGKEDPKVGLVLSGGGAKGLAHIGVLKVLEDAGVRIDYIGGTSMGAIVGGLYASGYTAAQLDSIFHVTNFDKLIQDGIPRSSKTFYEKREAEKYALSLPFDDFKISFPSGLSKGQNVYNLISRLTLHLDDKTHFEELPIPFFCVAVNVETGEEVILDQGYLPQAIAASAAIPTLFSPVLIDGRMLTDGGVVNNYPVEELRERGADIIIGVDVQDELSDRDELTSVFKILTQISNFRTVKDMETKVKKTDVYINPAIEPFSVTSFGKGEEIIEAGMEAATEKFEVLKQIAALQKPEDRQYFPLPEIDSLFISDVRIEGNHSYPRSYILGKLRLKFPIKTSYKDFNLGINNLSATGNFNKINYKLLPLNDAYVLVLQLEENPNKMKLKMSLHYDDLYKSAALFNITRNSLFLTNDVTSFDFILGDNSRYNFEYYIDKGYYWSLGVRSRYNSFQKDLGIDFFENQESLVEIDVNRLEVDYTDVTNQFYMETLFGRVFSIGAGAEHKYLEVDSETIGSERNEVPVTIFDKSNYYSTFGYLRLDTYDEKYYPAKGVYFHGDFHFYFAGTDFIEDFNEFSVAKGKIGYAFPLLPKLTGRLSSEAGFHLGTSDNKSLHFFLGGYGNDFINNIVPFLGYDFMELSADSYIKGMVELDYEIFPKSHLLASASYANLEDDLYSTGNWWSLPTYSGYSLGYGLETFMGPLELRYSYSPEVKATEWFFSLGFWF